MSSRLKERGGAGGKVMAAKPRQPMVSDKAPPPGKENRRSISAGRTSLYRQQRQPEQPFEKPPSTVRWSTSSIPKTRLPTDARNTLRASSEIKPPRTSTTKAPERCHHLQTGNPKFPGAASRSGSVGGDESIKKVPPFGGSVRRDGERRSASVGRSTRGPVPSTARIPGSSVVGDLMVFDSKFCKQPSLVVGNAQVKTKEASSGKTRSNSTAQAPKEGSNGSEIASAKSRKGSGLDFVKACVNRNEIKVDKDSIGLGNSGVKNRKGSGLDCGKNCEIRSELKGDKKGEKGLERYPSDLHEKLAALEGKVQRIATDIRKTKELLDSSSMDASRTMLSDIQRKIVGIEKTVGHVINDSQEHLLGVNPPAKDEELGGVKRVENNFGPWKGSTSVPNEKDLESRFIHPQKLVRCETLGGIHGGRESFSKEDNSDAVIGDELCNVDENPIALEFLASLDEDRAMTTLKNKAVKSMNVLKIMEPDNVGFLDGQCDRKGFASGLSDANALTADERLDEFDDQENNRPVMVLKEDSEESFEDRVFVIGHKTSTGGWFVSEGEAALLVHSDGSCTYFDIANNEEKAQYEAPPGFSNNSWRDCWLIRAPGVDGCSGKYVVAASAGNTLEPGFCSWDFYKKDIQAARLESVAANSSQTSASSSSRTVLAPLSDADTRRRTSSCATPVEAHQWWYRPCGYLIVSTSSKQNIVSAYDVRDGDLSMTWVTRDPVASMEYSCPLQWKSRGKVFIAGTETICLWDVNSLNPQPLRTVSSEGKNILALHVNNTDGELGGGVRQRISSSESEGNDGVFCTSDDINILDHRSPSGIGLKIPISSSNPHSVFARGDSILLGCTDKCSASKPAASSFIRSFSVRKSELMATYSIPGSAGAHSNHSSLAQVWGNSNLVMGISGMGLSTFDAVRDDELRQLIGGGEEMGFKGMIGPDDLYRPSFDYAGGRVLLISRDRPAMWRYFL